MHYEIYIDSLFLLNLGMNLYLLELTNIVLHHTATWKRIVLGALMGSISSVFPFFIPLGFPAASLLGFVLEIICMSKISFRTLSPGAYLHVLEVLSTLTMLLGALLQHFLRIIPVNSQLPVLILLLIGGICFLVIHHLVSRSEKTYECKVTLQSNKTRLRINALVDTGNSLIEPISGLPVAVLDKKVFDCLFMGEKPAGFRVIPYRSIDKKTGILPGYLIPSIKVEWKGICREFRNVYVGVRSEEISDTETYKMIINPEMLKERKMG